MCLLRWTGSALQDLVAELEHKQKTLPSEVPPGQAACLFLACLLHAALSATSACCMQDCLQQVQHEVFSTCCRLYQVIHDRWHP